MKRIRIYRHPECRRCARIARTHHRLDWLDRIEDTTVPPPGRAPVRMGEIVVEDLRSGRLLEGLDALRAIWRQVPAYLPLLPLLAIPPLARRADADVRGCTGACELPGTPPARRS